MEFFFKLTYESIKRYLIQHRTYDLLSIIVLLYTLLLHFACLFDHRKNSLFGNLRRFPYICL